MKRAPKFLSQLAVFLDRPHSMPAAEYAAVEAEIAALAEAAGITFTEQVEVMRGTLAALRDVARDAAALDGAKGGRPAQFRAEVVVIWTELRRRGVDRRQRARIIAGRLGADAAEVREAVRKAIERGDLRDE